MADLNTRISDFVWKNLNEKHVNGKNDPFWKALNETGTELWLDTGDIDEAEAIWTSEMSALTTNNSLLNNEIQKGIYDIFISEAKTTLRELPTEESKGDRIYAECPAWSETCFKIRRICKC